jgi:hypothetical protein
MAGFFDLTDPDNAALLGLASGLLQAGAPSRLPVPLGAALGRGLATGLDAGMAAQHLRQSAALRQRLAAAGVLPLAGAGDDNAALWPIAWGGPAAR